jgi:hypothetical protein
MAYWKYMKGLGPMPDNTEFDTTKQAEQAAIHMAQVR